MLKKHIQPSEKIKAETRPLKLTEPEREAIVHGEIYSAANDRDHLPETARLAVLDQQREQSAADPASDIACFDVHRVLDGVAIRGPRTIGTRIGIADDPSRALGNKIGIIAARAGLESLSHLVDGGR